MAAIILIIVLSFLISFAGVIFFGAPYLPTLKLQIKTALELADLSKGQTLIELGCGDGRVLIAAAQEGINCVGYELNPIMALIAWLRTRRYSSLVKIEWGDFWRKSWPEADAIFVFLLDKYMDRLDKKCIQYPYKPLKLVSFAFSIKAKKPIKTVNGVFLYHYK